MSKTASQSSYCCNCPQSKEHVKLVTRHVWERYIEKAEDTSAVCLLFATAGALLSKSFNGTDPVSGSL